MVRVWRRRPFPNCEQAGGEMRARAAVVPSHAAAAAQASPWATIEDTVVGPSAALVGALPSEVVVMNSLTVNLHLLMVPFFRRAGQGAGIVLPCLLQLNRGSPTPPRPSPAQTDGDPLPYPHGGARLPLGHGEGRQGARQRIKEP